MGSHTIEDLTSCVLDFQGNMARVIYRKKTTLVEPDVEETHATALDYIWTNSRLQIETAPDGSTLKWRQLGFASENLSHEFTETGVLGLDCLVRLCALAQRGVVNSHRKRKTLCRVTRIIFQRLCKSKIPDLYSGGVLSHVHRTRSSSSYRNIGVSWLPDARFPLQYDSRRYPNNVVTSQMRRLPSSSLSFSTFTRSMRLPPTSPSKCGMKAVLRWETSRG